MARKYKPKFVEVEPEPTEPTIAEAELAAAPAPVKKAASKTDRPALQKYSTDGDIVDVWERRMLNPAGTSAPALRIKTPGMRLRWINLANRGRYQRARFEQGWVPVEKHELVDEREIYGVTYTSEQYVCRGEKQTEMLMKMPAAVYRKIQQRAAELNTASYKKLKDSMGSAGSRHFGNKYGGSAGDQAGEIANNFVGSVKFGTERVSSDELLD